MIIKIDTHCVVFFRILDLPILVDEFAFLIIEFLFRDYPVVIQLLSLLLEKRIQFLFFLDLSLQFGQFFFGFQLKTFEILKKISKIIFFCINMRKFMFVRLKNLKCLIKYKNFRSNAQYFLMKIQYPSMK